MHSVTLSSASSVATTYSLSLADGTATGGGTDYTSTLTNAAFSNGVTISGGTITVPAGVTSFTVTVPTSADTIDEANETYTLTVGAASGTGTITDDDGAPTITGIEPRCSERQRRCRGRGHILVYTVTLSNASSVATTYALALADGSATGGGTDYTSTLTNAAFSNGVTMAGGTITVPAGVTSFTVTVPTSADSIAEVNETYTLTVGAASGTGTITDDDGAPTIASVSADTQSRGDLAWCTPSPCPTPAAAPPASPTRSVAARPPAAAPTTRHRLPSPTA